MILIQDKDSMRAEILETKKKVEVIIETEDPQATESPTESEGHSEESFE